MEYAGDRGNGNYRRVRSESSPRQVPSTYLHGQSVVVLHTLPSASGATAQCRGYRSEASDRANPKYRPSVMGGSDGAVAMIPFTQSSPSFQYRD